MPIELPTGQQDVGRTSWNTIYNSKSVLISERIINSEVIFNLRQKFLLLIEVSYVYVYTPD